nr:MAG TPA: hypothetical protein [Podoviridae sp. ctfN46]
MIFHKHRSLPPPILLRQFRINNKWATFPGYPSIRITCFVLMKFVYSQQKKYHMGTKIALLHIMKSNFDKILTERYIPRNIQAKKDELGCVKLPAGSLICPVDFKPVTNKEGKKVTAIKYSLKHEEYHGSGIQISDECKMAMIYLIIINVFKHVFLRNRMHGGNRDQIEINTNDFIDILSDGCAYFCYRHVLRDSHEDMNYQLISLKAWAEGEIMIALSDIIKYKHRASKTPRIKDMFVKKGESVYTCLDKNLDSNTRRWMANKSRKLNRVKMLSKIIFSARNRNINKIYKVTKKRTVKFNVSYLMDRLNIKLSKEGMMLISQRTVYRMIKEVLSMCCKTISDLYDEVKKNNGIVNTKDRKNITIGHLRLSYRGTIMHIIIAEDFIKDVFLEVKGSEMSKAG